MENQDWENSWKQYFKPTPVGARLLVRPSWEPAGSGGGRIELVVDPSSSFGTGTHATTKMCLERLDLTGLSGARVLDMGCGSGILACAALRLGAQSAVCCDIELASMAATRENMRRNGLGEDRYTAVLGDILADSEAALAVGRGAPYDFILANIVSDVLMAMAEKLTDMLDASGRIALSGIIDERAREVEAAFCALALETEARQSRDGWTMLVMRKAR